MSTRSLTMLLALAALMSVASCASFDCAYDVKARPEPVYLAAEEGVFYGQNYTACFVIDGVVHKEYIPECAYRYYYDRQNQRRSAAPATRQ
ncbi:MAG TPA: hypothetical protein PKJ17_02545 [Syntrophorhabdaceae bacterium]|nr:hypothetical protein [Syntrophorhabdaceae bacterium]